MFVSMGPCSAGSLAGGHPCQEDSTLAPWFYFQSVSCNTCKITSRHFTIIFYFFFGFSPLLFTSLNSCLSETLSLAPGALWLLWHRSSSCPLLTGAKPLESAVRQVGRRPSRNRPYFRWQPPGPVYRRLGRKKPAWTSSVAICFK